MNSSRARSVAPASRLTPGLCSGRQLVATLVAEIILCCKEINTKTRAAAYELLVDIAHAMHDARPPPDAISDEEAMGAPRPVPSPRPYALLCLAP